MDFIFEDDVDEVGAEIEAFCPKCKADSTHVVVSKYEDEIRRVQCNPCGDVHAFRKPRGETEEETPEPISVKKRAAAKKLTWEETMAKGEKKPKRAYSPRDTYKENELVNHSIFGMGFVAEVMTENKVEITFKDGRRILVHNRSDVQGPPPPPPPPVVEKPLKGKKGAVAPVPPPPPLKGKKGEPQKPVKLDPKAAAAAAKTAAAAAKEAEKVAKAGKNGKPVVKAAPAKAAPAKAAPAKAVKPAKPAKAAPAKKPAPAKKAPAKKPAAKKPAAKKPGKKK